MEALLDVMELKVMTTKGGQHSVFSTRTAVSNQPTLALTSLLYMYSGTAHIFFTVENLQNYTSIIQKCKRTGQQRSSSNQKVGGLIPV